MKMRRVVTVLAAFSALLMMQGSFAQTSSLSSDKIKNTFTKLGLNKFCESILYFIVVSAHCGVWCLGY